MDFMSWDNYDAVSSPSIQLFALITANRASFLLTMNGRRRILPSIFNLLGVIIFIKLFLTSKSSPITNNTLSLRAFAPALDSNNSVPRSCWKIITKYSQYDNSWNPDQYYTDNLGCDGKVEQGSLQFKFSLACSTLPSTEQDNSMLKVGCFFNGFNQSFLLRWDNLSISKQDWITRCKKLLVTPILTCVNQSADSGWNVTTVSVLQALGFKSSSPFRMCDECRRSNSYCGYVHYQEWKSECFCDVAGVQTCRSSPKKTMTAIIGTSVAISTIFITVVFITIYWKISLKNSLSRLLCLRKKDKDNSHKVEAFLSTFGSMAPKRYKYYEIKKMTDTFKVKLGQGGYGCVFKGNLADGRDVAVKVLTESKGNGEEFVNEVASIGRTYHINIVTLLGFCSEGPRRALVYEFMPNGSLEKVIYNRNQETENPSFGWEKLLQIAVGIARGLEYLHRGCSMRILHFDIKPHNILLDDKYCPKISDFGLAKLCPNQDTGTISMLVPRGTVGYIAPEVFCRSMGRVSYRSDVYSYGMMMLEMAGGRKNVDVHVDNTSEIYFPHWVFKRIEQNESLGLEDVMNDEEEGIARKMVMVGLWCIQTDPGRRPSMSKVLEMLEGDVDGIEMPPTPFPSSSH